MIAVVFALSVLSQTQAQAPTCLAFEPSVVELTGVLARKTFPGPPNYEDVRAGDAEETGFYLELDAAICAVGGQWPTEGRRTSQSIQLLLSKAGYDTLRPRLGKRVTVKGRLMPALTMHHHAELLLSVTAAPKR